MSNPLTVEVQLTARRMDGSTYKFPVLVEAQVLERDGIPVAAMVTAKTATTKENLLLTLEQQEHVEDSILRTWNSLREEELAKAHAQSAVQEPAPFELTFCACGHIADEHGPAGPACDVAACGCIHFEAA